jgi:hypothetical protein
MDNFERYLHSASIADLASLIELSVLALLALGSILRHNRGASSYLIPENPD